MPHFFLASTGRVLKQDMSGGVGELRTVYRPGAKVTGRKFSCSRDGCSAVVANIRDFGNLTR